MGHETQSALAKRLGNEWTDLLLIPDVSASIEDSNAFVQSHFELLQICIQEKISTLKTNADIHKSSVLIMGLALHLANAIGADSEILANHWVDTAISFGAQG